MAPPKWILKELTCPRPAKTLAELWPKRKALPPAKVPVGV